MERYYRACIIRTKVKTALKIRPMQDPQKISRWHFFWAYLDGIWWTCEIPLSSQALLSLTGSAQCGKVRTCKLQNSKIKYTIQQCYKNERPSFNTYDWCVHEHGRCGASASGLGSPGCVKHRGCPHPSLSPGNIRKVKPNSTKCHAHLERKE